MIQHVIAVYRHFTKCTGRSAGSRRLVSLNVAALEERATPTAMPTFTLLAAAPQTVLVAPPSSGSLPNPLAGQTIVRLDVIGPGETPRSHSAEDAADLLVQHRQESDAPDLAQAAAEKLAASEEEMEEFLAAQQEA